MAGRIWRAAMGAAIGALAMASSIGLVSADQGVKVTLTEWKIEPSSISVKPGEKVVFVLTNPGQRPHDLRIEGQGVAFEAIPGNGNLAAGQQGSYEFTFDKEGEYQMWCPVGNHRAQGMEGTFRVSALGATSVTQLPRTGDIAGLAIAAGGALMLGAGWMLRGRRPAP